MDPVSESDTELVYVVGAVTYRLHKVDPPIIAVEADYGHPDMADRPQTWLEVKVLFDAA